MKESKNRTIKFGIIVVLLCMLYIPLVSAASGPAISSENISESISLEIDNTPVQFDQNATALVTDGPDSSAGSLPLYWNKTIVDGLHGYHNNPSNLLSPKSIAAWENGQLSIVYGLWDQTTQKHGIYYAELGKNGNWGKNSLAAGEGASIAIDAAGNIHVAYVDNSKVSKALWHAWRTKDNGFWYFEKVANGAYFGYPSIAIDPVTQQPRICCELEDDYLILQYSKRNAAGGWSYTSIPGFNMVGRPALAIDSHGTPHILFENTNGYSDSNSGMFYLTYNGKVWLSKRLEGNKLGSGYYLLYPSIAISPVNDLPVICYNDFNYDTGDSALVYGEKHADGTWYVGNVIGWGSSAGNGCSITVDKNGNPYISHYERSSSGTSFDLKVFYWYSGSWHTNSVNRNVGKASENDFTSLTFDKEGKLSIAYGKADPSAWVASSDLFVARQISAPVVTSIVPSSGSTGTTVNPLHIYGDGFEFGATITLAPTSSSPVVVSYPKVLRVSPTELTAELSIPSTMTPGASVIRVRNPDGKYSDFPFTVVKPTITLISPNGYESWSRGTTHAITWRYTGNPGSTVKIVLVEETSTGIPKITTIADNVPIRSIPIVTGKYGGSYSWTIPLNQALGTRYKIAIQSKSQPAISDVSDNYFRIISGTTGTITVTSPNGGNTLVQGTTPTITWTSSGTVGSYVKIELLKAGGVVKTISPSTPNDGSYVSWTITSDIVPGNDYRIRITSTTNPSITDTSNADFTITSPTSITVTVPNGGQIWKRGTSETITWDYAGNPGTEVKITRLNKTGAIVGTITDKTLIGSGGHGSFLWNINPTGSTGTDCKIKIQSLSQPSIFDTSNNYFTLLPASSPSGLLTGSFMMD